MTAASGCARKKQAELPYALPALVFGIALEVCSACAGGGERGDLSGAGASVGVGAGVGWTEPEVVASGVNSPHLVVADEARVYWASDDGTVRALAHEDHGVAQMLATGQSYGWPGDLDQDAANLYITTGDTVVRVPKAGGSLFVLASGQDDADQLSLSATHIYFSSNAGVSRVSLAGGVVELLAEIDGEASGVSVSESGAVVSLEMIGSIGVLPPNGGTISVIASGLTSPKQVETSAGEVFWAGGGDYAGDGEIWRSDQQGQAPKRLASGLRWPHFPTVFGAYVYFSDVDGGLVARVPKSGGALEVVAKGQASPLDVAVSPPYVYWCSSGDGTLRRAKGSFP